MSDLYRSATTLGGGSRQYNRKQQATQASESTGVVILIRSKDKACVVIIRHNRNILMLKGVEVRRRW